MEYLRKTFNEILKTEEIPEQWLKSSIILFHKKGDRADMNNYRPLSVTSQVNKLFAKIIQLRTSFDLDEHQTPNQAGFRNGYSTVDHIFTIDQIIEKTREFNQPLFLAFNDYYKAFDSIEHPFLWMALKSQGVHDKYIRLMKKIYENSTATIKLEKSSHPFKIERGIKQGCCFSPKEFNGALQMIFSSIDWENFGVDVSSRGLHD
jgi:hypothetical protein